MAVFATRSDMDVFQKKKNGPTGPLRCSGGHRVWTPTHLCLIHICNMARVCNPRQRAHHRLSLKALSSCKARPAWGPVPQRRSLRSAESHVLKPIRHA